MHNKHARGFRPKLLSLLNFTCFLVLVISLFWIWSPPVSHKVLGTVSQLNKNLIVQLTNQQRQNGALAPLNINSQLTLAADAKAQDMITKGYWDHLSPSNNPPWQFILDAGYIYHFAGENLAKDYYDEKNLVLAWMQSTDHRNNIMSEKFKDTGIGIATGELNGQQTVLIVQLFASPFSEQELAMVANNQAQIVPYQNYQSSPLLQNQVDTISKSFSSTRLVASLIFIILLLSLVWEIIRVQHKLHFRKFARKYWLNLVFILFLGAVIAWTYYPLFLV